MTSAEQRKVCAKFGAAFLEVGDTEIVGLARNVTMTSVPIHGLRHPPESGTSGWHIWSGDFSDADDFFQPVHASHLDTICPQIVKFLGLGPGWRFLIADDYLDVWYDEKLLST